MAIAERFWEELQSVMATLRDLQDSLVTQEPPAVRPEEIQHQQKALQEIRAEIDQVRSLTISMQINKLQNVIALKLKTETMNERLMSKQIEDFNQTKTKLITSIIIQISSFILVQLI